MSHTSVSDASPDSRLDPRIVYGAIAALLLVCCFLIVTIIAAIWWRSTVAPPARTNNWELVDTGFCTFRHPPTMEIRKGSLMKAVAATINAQAGVEGAPEFVVQPKGMDAFAAGSFDTYARMLVSTEVRARGEFLTQSQAKRLTAIEIQELEKVMREGLDGEFAAMNSRMPAGMKVTMTNWKGAKTARLGNRTALVITFQRKMGNNRPVEVSSYAVFDNDRMHKVVVSYREEERRIWETDFSDMLATIRFKAQ